MPVKMACSECGARLSDQESSRGLCPACLLALGLTGTVRESEEADGPAPADSMIGSSISHYFIVEKLGQGGMGEVFLAEDTKLHRKVALKFLPGELGRDSVARLRFLREAKAAAALDHPCICKIYEIDESGGRSFISMEYVQGRNLRERLKAGRFPIVDAVQAARELAEALQSAFLEGIMHRDLKPSNVMFTPDGHLKVLDFGLAKRIHGAKDEKTEDSWFSDLTETGAILGTPAYMSPEQLRSQELDHRSDIFSLGILLYEMSTGEHPFLRESKLETINAIVSARFPPLSENLRQTSPRFERTLKKMLERSPQRRFRTFGEVRESLTRLLDEVQSSRPRGLFREMTSPGVMLTSAAVVVLSILFIAFLSLDRSVRKEVRDDQTIELAEVPRESNPRIAVLPFVNLGPGEQDEFLGEGLADSLITRLTGVQGLSVISRPSAMYFKGKNQTLPEIAERLQADYVLNGSFQRPGTDLVVNVQLVRASDDTTVWAREYRQAWTDVLRVQAEISQRVVENINPTLAPEEEAALQISPVENVGAYELYLHGRFFLAQRSPAALETAISYFQRALALDPGSAPAYSGLADAYTLLGATGYGALPPAEVMPKAEQAARKALAIDPGLAEAHTSLASTLMAYYWNWEESEKHFKTAVRLNPGYSTGRHWYGLYLAATGNLESALREIEIARRLDPLSPAANASLARCRYYRREYDEAIAGYERALQLDPDFGPAHLGLGLAYVKKYENSDSRIDQISLFLNSISEFEKGVALPMDVSAFVTSLIMSAPEEEEWRDQFPPFLFAMAYTILGDSPQALEWLDRAVEERSEYLVYIAVDPIFDVLRSSPEFDRILQRVGLSTSTSPESE